MPMDMLPAVGISSTLAVLAGGLVQIATMALKEKQKTTNGHSQPTPDAAYIGARIELLQGSVEETRDALSRLESSVLRTEESVRRVEVAVAGLSARDRK
jgi:hypothetical protein